VNKITLLAPKIWAKPQEELLRKEDRIEEKVYLFNLRKIYEYNSSFQSAFIICTFTLSEQKQHVYP